MPRQVLNQRTGEVTEYPDGTSDEQILAPLQAKAVQSPFGIAAGLARSSLEQYLNRPQSTLPGLGAKDVMGLTPEQVTNTQNMIQQSNMQNQQMSFQEKARQRHETQVALEQEKDRQQQIKLQSMQFKNQEAARKYEEDKYNARLKEETIRKEADANRPKAADYQLIQQADGAYARVDKLTGVVEPIALQGRMPQPKGGAGGAGADKASNWDKIVAEDGSIVYVNPVTQEVRQIPGVKAKPTGSGADPLREKALSRMAQMQDDGATPAEIIDMLGYYGESTKDIIQSLQAQEAAAQANPSPAQSESPSIISSVVGAAKNFMFGEPGPAIAPPIGGKAEVSRQTGTSKSTGKRITRITYSDGTHQDIEG